MQQQEDQDEFAPLDVLGLRAARKKGGEVFNKTNL